MKISRKGVLFNCNFEYKHSIYKINHKKITQTIKVSYISVRIVYVLFKHRLNMPKAEY